MAALVAAGLLATSAKVSDSLRNQREYGQADVAVTPSVDTYRSADGSGMVAGPGTLPAGPQALLPAGSRTIAEVLRSDDILTAPRGGRSSSVSPL